MMRRGHSISMAAVVALAALTLPRLAAAQEPANDGFGNRDAFVFSVEDVFGFTSHEFTSEDASGEEESNSTDSLGLQPLLWGNIGLHDISSSGLTLGVLLGAGYDRTEIPFFGQDVEISVATVRIGPRIGYAGSLQPNFGYWIRGGPSALMQFASIESDGEDETASAYMFAISGEAYAVIVPAPHFGILIGPHADIHVWGNTDDGDDVGYTAFGLGVGLMGEFW
jgi:hypothetical protein